MAATVTIVSVLTALLALNSLSEFRSLAQVSPLLPQQEVETLAAISRKFQNTGWNAIRRNSCGSPEWNRAIIAGDIESNVTCDCSFSSGTVCHVTVMKLKGYNLTGILPPELGNLTFLTELDLTRNYLNGTIPPSLGQLSNLTALSLLGNRLSGSIPSEIGNLANLESLVLEDNLLTGPLPRSLGALRSLSRLLLSANNFTGSIPDSFGNLLNITDIRIDGSSFSGKLPEFMGNWTNLKRLDLQGSSFQGPIPSSISMLTNLTDLRISDLTGPSSVFPDLKELTKLKELVLRNCLMTGSIPDYIGEMTQLKTVDFSFNSLSGPIPATLQSLESLDYTFLNNNSLTGEVPGWILNSKNNFDLSYNNFTGNIQPSCQQNEVNLVSSYSPALSSPTPWCLKKDLPCSRNPRYHSLFINCGGPRTTFEDKEYDEDLTTQGPTTFFSVSERWAYSSTGIYLGNSNADYLATDTYGHNVTSIYQNARLAPQSLKYYALCMLKGSYTLKLHFAEIMFSNDQTFSSLGRRIFDISIQGRVVRKDFDIMAKAGGVGIGITEVFENVTVDGSTLEIQLYWSGKGTTAIPDRGVYGPLISAITVTPNFPVDEGGSSGLSGGAIAGIVISVFVVVLFICGIIYKKTRKEDENQELRGLDLQTGFFTLRQLKHATNNFDAANKIGEGGFGPVYKGMLSDGGVIAVKQLSSKSKQGNREFVNEIGMISALQHPNLVKLYGCCIEGNQLLLVYEYLENNSLARALFGNREGKLMLDWQTRKRILLGIAKGLYYLHEESRLKIVHRDIKATNVLLDRDLNAKISDFGLAKLDEEENTHISTRIAGTIGYMAPEYAMRGYLTDKADVYSFGIVILETVSGKSNTNYRPKEEFVYLLDWAYVLHEQGNLLELVDPELGSNFSKDEARKLLNLALLCTNPSPTLRPPMSSVVKMMEGKAPVQAPNIMRGESDVNSQDARFRAFQTLSQDSHTNITTASWESRSDPNQKSITMDVPWTTMDTSSAQSKDYDDLSQPSSSARLL
ncbi:Probable LRR receptor-like serine/threonine-protein kinase At1g53430 [Linum grandiflorum]